LDAQSREWRLSATGPLDADVYCREVEAHLCRRNEGHLVRVVGPAFLMVAAWHAQGVPLTIVCRGIDRVVERRAAKGPGRRPLRLEFCEADVLDAFDEWRRAVGIGTAGGGALGSTAADQAEPESAEAPSRASVSLRAHLDRVVTRLTDYLATTRDTGPLVTVIERIMHELDALRAASRTARGDARAAHLARLTVLDGEMMDAAESSASTELKTALDAAAESELAGYRGRMPEEAFARARAAASRKLLRERLKLPEVAYPC
jgi:hypothetical protein